MNRTILFLSIFLLPLAGITQQQSTVTSARDLERSRDIRLPKNDSHWGPVKDFVEEVPDSDYFHASADTYESFNDFKYGIRIHWGIYSILQIPNESWGFQKLSNEKKQEYQELYKSFNPQGFNAEEWMDLFDSCGLKCFAFTSKHHEGFSMFDTKTKVRRRVNYTSDSVPVMEDCDLSYSIMETPFKRDIVKELCEAGRNHHMKIDLYFSHPDWYDADFRPYNYHPLQTEDSRVNSYLNYGDEDNFKNSPQSAIVPDPSPEETARMMQRHRDQLTELLTNYGKIDMICLDQWLGRKVWPQMKETIKQLRKIQPNVMFRCRGIGNYGDYYTPEGFVPGSKENSKMPWMTIHVLGQSFSYDSVASHYKGSRWIVSNLIDAVSKGGNFMVSLGPDGNGKFHPIAVKQLLEAGEWLKLNGEGIYATRSRTDWKEGDYIRYTRSKDNSYVYAFATKWTGKTLVLKTVKPSAHTNIHLLGHAPELKWKYRNNRLIIQLPERSAIAAETNDLAWCFKIAQN